MNKNAIRLFCLAIIATAMTSCASYLKTAPLMGITNNSINTYAAADIDYESVQKVSAEVNTQTFLGISLIKNGNKTLKSTTRYRGIGKRESQALYIAKEKSGADIILEPEFESEKHSWLFGAYRTSKTVVKGWGVKVKGIKEDKHNAN